MRAKKPWHLGNTTVRTPYRLRDGLRALADSPLLGNLVGKDKESAFARLLHRKEIVFVARIEDNEGDDFSDLGRKWRSALSQLGFITPKLTRKKLGPVGNDPLLQLLVQDFSKLTGRPFEVTPNGERLISAENLPAQQECFLRSLVAYQLPSILEKGHACPAFSPLRIVLKTIYGLERAGLEPRISIEEMASVVQLAKSEEELEATLDLIGRFRRDHNRASNKPKFDAHFRRAVTGYTDEAKLRTLTDYADLNFRYLKATGLFNTQGRGIVLAKEKSRLIDQILSKNFRPLSDKKYLRTIWKGADLPTDHADEATQVIQSLADLLRNAGQIEKLPTLSGRTPADLTQIRLRLEDKYQRLQEESFARKQAAEWKEILAYIRALAGSRETARVPAGEAPAYLEWALWRAFLAIDSLVNKPWEARRFNVDQDFLPVGTAPGHGPDMIFEFDDFVLVVEVTLTTSSRQEAAEGEPVRRHVAEIVDKHAGTGKQVYGLFIAVTINSNTAETFRIGSWYRSDDSRLSLAIVPLTLTQFAAIFEAGFARGLLTPAKIKQIISDCRSTSSNEAPQWKVSIKAGVEEVVSGLMQ